MDIENISQYRVILKALKIAEPKLSGLIDKCLKLVKGKHGNSYKMLYLVLKTDQYLTLTQHPLHTVEPMMLNKLIKISDKKRNKLMKFVVEHGGTFNILTRRITGINVGALDVYGYTKFKPRTSTFKRLKKAFIKLIK